MNRNPISDIIFKQKEELKIKILFGTAKANLQATLQTNKITTLFSYSEKRLWLKIPFLPTSFLIKSF